MPARTGREYIDTIGSAGITVEIHGDRTTGRVGEIESFKNLIQTYAALYDLQK
jgi:aromatic ring hydroxylase